MGQAYTAGSTSAREAKLATWVEIATAAGFEDPFEISENLVFTIVGCLKAAGYRSAESYMHLAKQHSVASGRVITDSTMISCARAARAAKRGRGPAKQASPIPLGKLAELSRSPAPLVAGGPVWPHRAVLTASWWLLREIEASNIRVGHVRLDMSSGTLVARILLPVSKTDISALGAWRAHQCMCGKGPKHPACPACIVKDQIEWLEADARMHLSEFDAEAFARLPLFPTLKGEVVSKAAFIGTLEALAVELGLPVVLPSGVRAFTGHSPRCTGAIHMASAWLELLRIQLFGRWGAAPSSSI